MAVRDEPMPVPVVVFCDSCGEETDHDYLVPAGSDSRFVARNYLSGHKGWSITAVFDLCPSCTLRDSAHLTPDVWDEWDGTPEGDAALKRLQADLDLLPPFQE